MSSSNIAVSIVIVNWNVCPWLAKCLKTIETYTKSVTYEVIVVDNASRDGSVGMVKSDFPQVKLIALRQNLGFAQGNNRGLKIARGRHILFLNPDVELIGDAIGPMVRYLDAHANVGAVGCRLLNSDRSLQHSIGRFTRLSNLAREYFLREKADRAVGVPHPDRATTVDVVLGACLLVRGDVCRAMGGFDERYFMYHDETDLCLTLKQQGFRTVYYPEVSMIHHGSKSSTSSVESRQRTLHENRRSQYLFFRKHFGYATFITAKLIILLAMTGRLLALGALVLVPSRQADIKIKLRYWGKTVVWLLGH